MRRQPNEIARLPTPRIVDLDDAHVDATLGQDLHLGGHPEGRRGGTREPQNTIALDGHENQIAVAAAAWLHEISQKSATATARYRNASVATAMPCIDGTAGQHVGTKRKDHDDEQDT